jgi:hypothetical protein
MESLKGDIIKILPFRDLNKVSDLIYFEGPILSHFKDKYEKNLLFYWVDVNEEYNRWLVFQVSEEQLYNYLTKRVDLRSIVERPQNDIFYSVEIGDTLNYQNIHQFFKDDLIEPYLPEPDSFFESDVPSVYSRNISNYEESYLMEVLLDQAVFMKAEPSEKNKSKNHGLVDAVQGGNFLQGFGKSYNGMLAYSTRKEFQLRTIVDEKRVRKAIKQVIDSYPLNMVKTEAASFAVALSPNNITVVDEFFLNKEWRDSVFNQFKRDVINIDNKTEDEIDAIVKQYGEDYISEIYKPIIELYNSRHLAIKITDKNFKPKRTIHHVKPDVVQRLVRVEKGPAELPVERLALVKFNNSTGRITGTSQATLLDQAIQPSWHAENEIKGERKRYQLRHKLFAQYKIEDGIHIIEHDELDIYATGEGYLEAESNFHNEIADLYERLLATDNKELSAEDIDRKNFLMFYIKS